MRKLFLAFAIILNHCAFCHAQETHRIDSIDISYYESFCPGFEIRYNTIQTCKYSNDYSVDEAIVFLRNTIHQIENDGGLFDDINYFEGIRLLCTKYYQIGDYGRIDSTLLSVKKYVYENFETPFNFNDFYKYNRAAAWVEIRDGCFAIAQELLEQIIREETDPEEFLSVLQDLAICYLQTQQYDKFYKTVKDVASIADEMPLNNYNQLLLLNAKRLNAFLCILSEDDVDKGINQLEELAIKTNGDVKLSRFRCSILEDLSAIYIKNNLIEKYIQTKYEILRNNNLTDIEKAGILESLVGTEWLYASNEDIIRHTIKHSNLVKSIALDNLIMFPSTKNISLWSQIIDKINKDSYILNSFPDDKDVCELIYNNLLFMKNQLMTSDYAIRQYVYENGDETQRSLLCKIDTLRNYIVHNAANEEYGESYSYDLAFQEIDLMRALPMKMIFQNQIKTWKDVANSLREDEIAIEITDCNVLFPQDSVYSQLMALIIKKNSISPHCIKLGNYYDIADDLRMLFSGDPLSINQVYSSPNNSICRMVWGNLENHLKEINTVYISTNTLLSFVNLGALLSSDGKRISDKWDIRLFTSTSEVISSCDSIQCTSATLFGGGSFGKQNMNRDELYAEIVRAITERGGFNELHGAIEEVTEINDELKKQHHSTTAFLGNEATEKVFRELNGNASQIIHIATHCFRITDMENNSFLSRIMAVDTREAGMFGTGFILANANSTWSGRDSYESDEDGIMLSEDISRLNLNGCDLLVLSGCQSGEGKMDVDGAFGLQRAFKRAGVNTMLLSLWNVEDNVTKDFMVVFYKSLLQTKNKYQAYKEAQNRIRNKYKNPYYWAAFIMLD